MRYINLHFSYLLPQSSMCVRKGAFVQGVILSVPPSVALASARPQRWSSRQQAGTCCWHQQLLLLLLLLTDCAHSSQHKTTSCRLFLARLLAYFLFTTSASTVVRSISSRVAAHLDSTMVWLLVHFTAVVSWRTNDVCDP